MPTRTWRGTIDSNWGTAGNWLEGAVPTSADDVVFDVSSSACTVNASARSCLTINFSAYTDTITMSNTITVGGNVTLGSSMIIGGSSALIVNANATLRSNGRVWSNPLTLSGTSRTYTLADNWTVSNVLTLNGTTSQIINGNTIYSSGNLTSNTTAITSGTTNIELNGGTWSNSSTGVLRNNLTFNGNVSVNGNVYYNTGTLTYTGGTVTTTGSTLNISTDTTTLNTSGMSWNNITLTTTGGVPTITNNSVITINGTFSIGNVKLDGSDFNCFGNVTHNASQTINGTATIYFKGNVNYSQGNNPPYPFRNNLVLDSGVNTVTFTGLVGFDNITVTYTSGTVNASGSTINVNRNTVGLSTFNTSSVNWGNIQLWGGTLVLSSDLNISGLLTMISSSTTVNGSFNINANGGISLVGVNLLQGTGSPALNLLGGTWSGSGGITLNTNFNGNVTISGVVAFGVGTLKYMSGTVTTTGSTLSLSTSTLDTNNMQWNAIAFGGTSQTVTLLSDLYLNDIAVNLSQNHIFNGNTIFVSRDLIGNGISSGIVGTSNMKYIGTGSITNRMSVGLTSFDVDTSGGTLTLSSTVGVFTSTSIKYTSGNVIYNGGLRVSSVAGQTLDWGHVITSDFSLNGAGNSTTLLRDIYTKNLSIGNNSGANTTTNGFKIYCSGNFISTNFNGNNVGTTEIVMNGTGNFQFFFAGILDPQIGTGVLRNNLTFNTTGTTNIIGNIRYNTGTITHSGGTVTSTGSTMNIGAATTIVVNNTGFTLNNINTSANVTFAGTNGFPINGTYACTTPGTTHTFVSTQTYSINSLTIAGTSASRVTLRSSSSGSKAIINLNSVQSEYYLNVTDIDGSGGATGWTFGGTVTNSDNWNASTTLYYVGTSNFSATGSWAPYSGGVAISTLAAPSSTEDIAFDVNSVNNCNMNAAGTCKSVNFSGYTATLTMTNTMTVSGNVALASGMSISGSSALIVNATHTFTSNGKTWPNPLVFTGSITITLTDDLTILGLFSLNLSVANTVMVFNGTVNINCYGGFTNNSDGGIGTSQGTGTTTLNIYGGTWSGQGMTRLDTNIIGNVTISTVRFTVRKLTHISGNVIALGSSWISGTLDVAGIRWNDIFNGGGTLLSDFNVGGVLGINNGGFGGAFNVNCYGGISVSTFLQNATGASAPTVNLYGGVFCPIAATQGFLSCNINILGDITIGDVILDTSNTVRYVSGNVRSTSNSILRITQNGNVLLNCDKVNFRNVTITAGRTITMNRFFNGTITTPTRVRCTTAGSIYAISFQDNLEKVAHNVKVSDCVVSNRNQLLLTGANSNKGTNTGIRYINNIPNGIAKNQAPISNQMMFGIGNISDPSFVAN